MDMTTRYMGLSLKNPLVASASPLSESLDSIRRLEDNGAAAVVMFSLFEEQIRHDSAALEYFFNLGRDSVAEAASYFPAIEDYDVGPGQYLDLVQKASEAVDIPVIASLNGISEHGWVTFAREMEEAGASAIELNVYYIPTEPFRTGTEVEQQYVNVLSAVKAAVNIPVAIKLGPYFSSFADMAAQLDEAGANALVLFNRFYQPDFDIERRTVVPSLALSTPDEIRLPLLWIALLYGRVSASLAATTGVHGPIEAIKYLMAGADVVMSTSAVLQQGPPFFARVLREMTEWMEKKGYSSVDQMRGSMSHLSVTDSTAFVRANYIKTLESYTKTTTTTERLARLKQR
ncbi:MAG TPA: dihydroorotate dehydrogenase-like protein [Vicinamibacterales bacterium]|jgi:dihydroorotate dehydrogenase (fumarate)